MPDQVVDQQVLEILASLAMRESGPVFLYLESRLKSNIVIFREYFRELFGNKVEFSFSLKTQPNFRVVRFFIENNFFFDVSSLPELKYLLSLGVSGKRICLGGVGVTDRAILCALRNNIDAIHCDSKEAYQFSYSQRKAMLKTGSIAQQIPTQLTIRWNLDEAAQKVGWSDVEIQESSFSGFQGLHVYLGRESYSLPFLQTALARVENLFRDSGRFVTNPKLYLGPGVQDLEIFSELLKKADCRIPFEIRVEAGRALCSSAGFYGAKVLSVKRGNQGQKIITIDGGLQHLGSPWISLAKGPLELHTYFFDAEGKALKGPQETGLIYGSLCLWHDCLHPRLQVPQSLKRGDWIFVPHMGAYGLTAGVPLFIGEKLPKEFYYGSESGLGDDESTKLQDVTHRRFLTYHEGF